jgi:hypothetical protein
MFTRARLNWAGLLAAPTTAVLIGAPAIVQAAITATGADRGVDEETTSPLVGRTVRRRGRCGCRRDTGRPRRHLDASGRLSRGGLEAATRSATR